MSPRVTCELGAIKTKVDKAVEGALFVTAENVLSDCKPAIPRETGALINSGRVTRLGPSRARIEWGGDAATSKYARPQYFGAYHHPGAANPSGPALPSPAKWYERTESSRGHAWLQMMERETRRRV